MEENLLSLVKSYIASEERLRHTQTRILKKKIQKLNDDLFDLDKEFVSRENALLVENTILLERLDKIKKIAYTLGVLIVILIGIVCFKF